MNVTFFGGFLEESLIGLERLLFDSGDVISVLRTLSVELMHEARSKNPRTDPLTVKGSFNAADGDGVSA